MVITSIRQHDFGLPHNCFAGSGLCADFVDKNRRLVGSPNGNRAWSRLG
jgi:hypothetical protein